MLSLEAATMVIVVSGTSFMLLLGIGVLISDVFRGINKLDTGTFKLYSYDSMGRMSIKVFKDIVKMKKAIKKLGHEAFMIKKNDKPVSKFKA